MRARPFAAAVLTAFLAVALVGCAPAGVSIPDSTRTPGRVAPAPGLAVRPVVSLSYDVADDLRSATGSETITFTPDQPVCEVVLRAWPNKPVLTRADNGMTIGTVSVDGLALRAEVQAAGASAGAFGTLVEVALPECRAAGTSLTITADFAMTMGPDTDERMGYATSGELAWFQTAYPLLDWQAGVGWVRDAAVDMYGETVTSEAFTLKDLSVTVPNRFAVAGVGVPGPTVSEGTRTTHRFSAPVMRDVSVMVGAFAIDEYDTSGTTVHLAVPDFARLNDSDEWRSQVDVSLAGLVDYLGPVPFADLWISIIPGGSEGIESSGGVQLGGRGRRVEAWLVTHELAHLWAYAMVGNNQARYPWLDESVASMIEAVVSDPQQSPETSEDYHDPDSAADDIGQPMSYFASTHRPGAAYNEAVYAAGERVLIEARDDAGHDRFDAALRDYLRVNAYRVASPLDFADAFADVPEVIASLERHNLIA